MTESSEFTPQQEFDFEGSSLPIQYIETQDVKEGVVCDVYTFEGGSDKDLMAYEVCIPPYQDGRFENIS